MLERSKEKALFKFALFRAMERRASRVRTNHRTRKPPSLALHVRESLHRLLFPYAKASIACSSRVRNNTQRRSAFSCSKQAKPPRSEDDPRRDRS